MIIHLFLPFFRYTVFKSNWTDVQKAGDVESPGRWDRAFCACRLACGPFVESPGFYTSMLKVGGRKRGRKRNIHGDPVLSDQACQYLI